MSNKNEIKIEKYKKKIFITKIIFFPIMILTIYSFLKIGYENNFDSGMFLILILYSIPFYLYFILVLDYKKRISIIKWNYKYKTEEEKKYYEGSL